MNKSKFLQIALVVIATFVSGNAFAIERSCTAKMYLKNKHGNEIKAGNLTGVENYYATGKCAKGSPNTCRKRAREAALRCANKHWETRWDRVRPSQCKPNYQTKNYELEDLKKRIEYLTRAGSPKEDRYDNCPGSRSCWKVDLWVTTWGPTKHCDSERLIHKGYRVY